MFNKNLSERFRMLSILLVLVFLFFFGGGGGKGMRKKRKKWSCGEKIRHLQDECLDGRGKGLTYCGSTTPKNRLFQKGPMKI